MMSEEYNKLKKKINIEKHETIGGVDLPEGRELKKKSSKIPKNNYAATMVSAARRQIIGGGAHKLLAAAARAHGSSLMSCTATLCTATFRFAIACCPTMSINTTI